MKPSRFGYVAPGDLQSTVDVLAAYGDQCKLLAGGQSLGPLLNLRLASPRVLVDLGNVQELGKRPHREGGMVVIYAMSRQRDVERDRLIAEYCPLVSQALPCVAHRTIRHRGTIGGSLAHADPAAELPAVALASQAEFNAQGPGGCRIISANSFFEGYFTTALAADEVLVSVQFPMAKQGSGSAWVEFAPRNGDYAIVGVAAVLHLNHNERIMAARLTYSGISDKPWRHEAVDSILVGERGGTEVFDAAADAAVVRCEPSGDLVGSAKYRRHLVRVLTARALELSFERARANR